jgi:hypothetical protein
MDALISVMTRKEKAFGDIRGFRMDYALLPTHKQGGSFCLIGETEYLIAAEAGYIPEDNRASKGLVVRIFMLVFSSVVFFFPLLLLPNAP